MENIIRKQKILQDQSSAKEYAKILNEVENEYYLIKREIDLSNNQYSLEDVFRNHGREAMIRSHFYHECMLKKIPCVLEVTTRYGRLDAIIEVDGKFIIIEFKHFFGHNNIKHCEEQLTRYLNHQYPLIVISDIQSIPTILSLLSSTKFETKIYNFDIKKNILSIYTYPQKND